MPIDAVFRQAGRVRAADDSPEFGYLALLKGRMLLRPLFLN
jgi:hypothetical protein